MSAADAAPRLTPPKAIVPNAAPTARFMMIRMVSPVQGASPTPRAFDAVETAKLEPPKGLFLQFLRSVRAPRHRDAGEHDDAADRLQRAQHLAEPGPAQDRGRQRLDQDRQGREGR